MSTIENLKALNSEYGNRPTMPPVHAALETWHALPKLLAFVSAYDHWLELYMEDAREDLEDDGSLESAVAKLDAARKALDG